MSRKVRVASADGARHRLGLRSRLRAPVQKRSNMMHFETPETTLFKGSVP
jgi:hypothetical protein